MSRTHPFLDVDNLFNLPLFLCTAFGILFHDTLGLIITFQIAPEVLKQGHLLLQFLGVLCEGVFLANILAITRSTFHIVDVVTIWVKNNLCGIVEEDPCGFI